MRTLLSRAWKRRSPEYERGLRLGRLGYEYGYPLLRYRKLRLEDLSVTAANRFRSLRGLATPDLTAVPAPNVDTLYSSAHLELREEPIVLTVPRVDEHRYYSIQLLDPYTNVVGYVGTRSTGNEGSRYAIAGPAFRNDLPTGLERIDAPYDWLWVIARTATDQDGGLAGAQAVQDGFRLAPLGEHVSGRPSTPPDDTVGSPAEQVIPGGLRFFDLLGVALAETPPPAQDAPLVDDLAAVGVMPGRRPSVDASLGPAARAGLNDAVGWTRSHPEPVDMRNGWAFPPAHVGDYGTDYCLRAAMARTGLGANRREESVYASTTLDCLGEPLTGSRRYVLRFERPPPADAFWSLTVYGPGSRLVPNALDRYALGSRSAVLHGEAGSLDIHLAVSGDVPEEDRWLPTPSRSFSLVLRLYIPRAEALDGTWSPPAVERL
jgi:hypothetical protein